MTSDHSQKGFTLVELALALMIIGLLIAGVLKGLELVENSKTLTALRQIREYRTAVTAFNSMYGSYPGDMGKPGERIPDCGAPPCNTPGNNNARIGNIHNWGDGDAFTDTSEVRTFWVHLTKAGLIKGLKVGDAFTGADGADMPKVDVGGVFMVNAATGTTGYSAQKLGGNYLVLKKTADGTTAPESSSGMTLRPAQAAQMDRKVDDGSPGTGEILAYATGGGTSNCITSAGEYDETLDGEGCDLYIRLTK